jgi:hypothetical protein
MPKRSRVQVWQYLEWARLAGARRAYVEDGSIRMKVDFDAPAPENVEARDAADVVSERINHMKGKGRRA